MNKVQKVVDSPRPISELLERRKVFKNDRNPLNLNLFNSDKYKDVIIEKKSIEAHLYVYSKETLGTNEVRGDCPEVIILKNICSRYKSSDDELDARDVELIVCLIKLNRQERQNRDYELVHDTMFDCMINMYKLEQFLESRFLFSMHSFD